MGGLMDRLTSGSNAFYFTFVSELLRSTAKKLKERDGDGVSKNLEDVVKYMEKVPPLAAAVTTEHVKLREACSQVLELMNTRAREGRDVSQTEIERYFGAIRDAFREWGHAVQARLLS